MLGVTFTQPVRLWLLVVIGGVLVAYVVLQRRTQHYAVRFTNLGVLDRVAPKHSTWPRHVVAVLFIGCIASEVVAFAGPQRVELVPRERATVVLAIDVSLSMTATDVAPSRIDVAKQAAKAFVAQVPAGFNIALVAFSGIATVEAPPTTDRRAVYSAIDRLQLGEGTAIGDAIIVSLDAISGVPTDSAGTSPPAVIVLLSDGTTTRGTPNSVAVQKAIDAHVPISTIAFGTSAGTVTVPPDPTPIAVPVDAAALATIANASGGKTFSAQSTDELNGAYRNIGSSIAHVKQTRSIRGWFVAIALLTALIAGVGWLRWSYRFP
jgi:Ca-activated chloride channel family protein